MMCDKSTLEEYSLRLPINEPPQMSHDHYSGIMKPLIPFPCFTIHLLSDQSTTVVLWLKVFGIAAKPVTCCLFGSVTYQDEATAASSIELAGYIYIHFFASALSPGDNNKVAVPLKKCSSSSWYWQLESRTSHWVRKCCCRSAQG